MKNLWALLGFAFTDPLNNAAEPLGEAVRSAVFHAIRKRALWLLIPLAGMVLVVFGVGYGKVPTSALVLWGGFVFMFTIARWMFLGHLNKSSTLYADKLKRLTILQLFSGALHALPLITFSLLSPEERAIVSILYVGLAIGHVGVTSGYIPMVWTYHLPMMGTLALSWATFTHAPEHRTAVLGLVLLMLLLVLIIVIQAKLTLLTLIDSIDSRMKFVAANTSLQSALEKAETANRAKTRFLAAASHDLRQPLHTLGMFSAALLLRPLDAKSTAIAKNINAAMQDLSTELDSLLDISKLDAGIVQINPKTLDLNALLENLRTLYLPEAKSKNLSIVVTCDANISVHTDRALFERILRNILDNALKYSHRGLICMSANFQPEAQLVSIAISDQGIGIATNDQKSIFDEFFQIQPSDGNTNRGLGLGLSIVQRLTTLLKIAVDVESTLGEGTTIHLEMPAQRAIVHRVPTRTPFDSNELKNVSVVVLDDEPTVRNSMQALLTEIGCTVRLASNGDEAIALVNETTPQIVLADMRLQNGTTGLETVQKLRHRYPELPAILISGDTDLRQQNAAQAAGLALLYKPVDLARLVGAIRRELAQFQPAQSTHTEPISKLEPPQV
jgi:two-component system, sensor histidine kinase